jgi:hypothetical protein
MGIVERVKAAAGRVTGRRGRSRGPTERNVGGRSGGTPPGDGQGGTGTGGGDNERNVGG